jgi:hypothetical protein
MREGREVLYVRISFVSFAHTFAPLAVLPLIVIRVDLRSFADRAHQVLVPPTVRPSMRRVGWPTPTGTL